MVKTNCVAKSNARWYKVSVRLWSFRPLMGIIKVGVFNFLALFDCWCAEVGNSRSA